MPKIEIINTGTELLIGRTLNTHQRWLCQELSQRGYAVDRQVTVADTGIAIQDAVREGLQRAELVICTGGLGPTSDDLTRQCIASLLNRQLSEAGYIWEHIQDYFRKRNRQATESTRIQAQVPEGAEVLLNHHGTAPGMYVTLRPNPFRTDDSFAALLMLPGPPRELHPMFLDQVLPLIQRDFPLKTPFHFKSFNTCGIGESKLQESLEPLLQLPMQNGLEVGYCSNVGKVDVRFAGHGDQALLNIEAAASILKKHFGAYIYGEGNECLESAVVRALTRDGKTLALAESCTGGHLAHRITNVPGASQVFLGGCVAYSNPVKMEWLGVRPETLERHGAVSEETAREMALGARGRFASDFAISITGIAGPSGGTEEKPVGTVCIALADSNGIKSRRLLNPFDRETFKQVTSQQALDMLRRRLDFLSPAT